jgi:hypothetical protein
LNFALVTQSLKTYGTIHLDSAAAEGQTRTNNDNDFGRGHDQLININKKTVLNTAKPGLIFELPPKLMKSLFYAAKPCAPRLRKQHDHALRLLNLAKLNKLKEEQLKELEKSEEAGLHCCYGLL